MSRASDQHRLEKSLAGERIEGVNMRVQHEVKFRMHAIDPETLERDPKTPIEVYDGGELDLGYVFLKVGSKRMVVDGRELARALTAVVDWSEDE